jgi:hypothetical protein
MNTIVAAAQEKTRRLLDIIPMLFQQGSIGRCSVLTGGAGLNLEFTKSRFLTDLDIKDLNPQCLPFRQRFDYYADELRSIANEKGYGFKIHVSSTPKAKFVYRNSMGNEDNFIVDVSLTRSATIFPPMVKSYASVGTIRVLELEEMLGGKLAMLSRPRLRGKKRYSDLIDTYNAAERVQNYGHLDHAFRHVMDGLGVTITPQLLRNMLAWHRPEKFYEGVREKTDQYVSFETVSNKLLDTYGRLFRKR